MSAKISAFQLVTQSVDLLSEIRRSPKKWKSGGSGGQDQYAGLPPAMREIDMVIKNMSVVSAELERLQEYEFMYKGLCK